MDVQKTAKKACRVALRPLVKLLIKSGVMYRDFSEMAKALYVEVASAEYGLRGRPTNLSRVALLTGLDRKEVRRVRDSLTSKEDDRESPVDRLSRVLSGWHQDMDFLDSSRRPRALNERGDHPSFASLVEKYGGDIAPSTMLKELRRVGAVGLDAAGAIIPLRRFYMPSQTDASAMMRSGAVLADVGETVFHNLFREEDMQSWFEGRATNRQVAASAIPAFRAYLEKEAMVFLESIDQWLNDHEVQDDDQPTVRLGLGVYAINSPRPKRKPRSRSSK